MRGRSRQGQPTLNLQGNEEEASRNIFLCGCGESYQEKGSFKKHNIEVHHGQFVDKSSHYLTHLTQVVLPITYGLHVKIQSSEPQEEVTTKLFNQEEIPIREEEMEANNQKLQHQEVKKKGRRKKTVKIELQNEKAALPEEIMCLRQNEPIEWNRFRLIRNHRVQQNSFFCGNCVLSFSNPQEYVVHCIQICQELKDLRSSHFIYSLMDEQTQDQLKNSVFKLLQNSQNKEEPPKKDPKQKYPGKRRGRKKKIIDPEFALPEPPLEQTTVHYDAQVNHEHVEAEPSSNIDGILHLSTINNNDQQRIYSCGPCLKTYNWKPYLNHIQRVHSEMVPIDSSHIAVRYRWREKMMKFKFLPMEEEPGAVQRDWHCPCKPDVKMSYTAFVEHQMDVHFGISMLYSLP